MDPKAGPPSSLLDQLGDYDRAVSAPDPASAPVYERVPSGLSHRTVATPFGRRTEYFPRYKYERFVRVPEEANRYADDPDAFGEISAARNTQRQLALPQRAQELAQHGVGVENSILDFLSSQESKFRRLSWGKVAETALFPQIGGAASLLHAIPKGLQGAASYKGPAVAGKVLAPLAGVAQSLLAPKNLAIMGGLVALDVLAPPVGVPADAALAVRAGAGAYFAYRGGFGSLKDLAEAKSAAGGGDWWGAYRDLVYGAANGIMAVLAGTGLTEAGARAMALHYATVEALPDMIKNGEVPPDTTLHKVPFSDRGYSPDPVELAKIYGVTAEKLAAEGKPVIGHAASLLMVRALAKPISEFHTMAEVLAADPKAEVTFSSALPDWARKYAAPEEQPKLIEAMARTYGTPRLPGRFMSLLVGDLGHTLDRGMLVESLRKAPTDDLVAADERLRLQRESLMRQLPEADGAKRTAIALGDTELGVRQGLIEAALRERDAILQGPARPTPLGAAPQATAAPAMPPPDSLAWEPRPFETTAILPAPPPPPPIPILGGRGSFLEQIRILRADFAAREKAETSQAAGERERAEESRQISEEQLRKVGKAFNVLDRRARLDLDYDKADHAAFGASENPSRPVTPLPVGSSTPILLAGEGRIEAHFAVVDAGSPLNSHDIEGNPNPNFPPDLQVREKSRDAMRLMAQTMSSRLEPAALGGSGLLQSGSPTVDYEGKLLVSGRSRANAIRDAYRRGLPSADAYRQFLLDHGESFGIEPGQIEATPNPMLVRVLPQGTNLAEVSRLSDVPETAALSDTEQALADSRQLTDATMSLYQGGAVSSGANQEFVRSFLSNIPRTEEINKLVDARGRLSKEGEKRIRLALFAKTFPGSGGVLEQLAESPRPRLRNLSKALFDAVPKYHTAIAEVPGADISPEISRAAAGLMALPNSRSVDDWLHQASFNPEDDSDLAVRDLLAFLSSNARSSSRITEMLDRYADLSRTANAASIGLFGAGPAETKLQLLRQAIGQSPEPTVTAEPPVRAPAEAAAPASPETARPEWLPEAEFGTLVDELRQVAKDSGCD